MFRRIRYRKWLVGGLALAALAAPAAAQAMPLGVGDSAGVALGPGTSAAARSNMSAAAYAALVAKSEALNARYASVRYGAPDGWYPHMVTVTRQQQATAAHSATGFDPNSPETRARLVAQGYVDGSIGWGVHSDAPAGEASRTWQLGLWNAQPVYFPDLNIAAGWEF